MKLDDFPVMLEVKHLAELFGIGERAARAWCASGKVPAVKIGRVWYVSRERLRAFVEG